MEPKKLSNYEGKGREIRYSFGGEVLGKHPELAALVSETITFSAQVDAAKNDIVSGISGENEALFAAFMTIKNTGARSEFIGELVKGSLRGETLAMYETASAATSGISRYRNLFAHHIWGDCDQVPNGLISISPKEFSKWARNMKTGLGHMPLLAPKTDPMHEIQQNLDNIAVYEEEVLVWIRDQMNECARIWQTFSLIIHISRALLGGVKAGHPIFDFQKKLYETSRNSLVTIPRYVKTTKDSQRAKE